MKKQRFLIGFAACLFLSLVACNKELTTPSANVAQSSIQPLGDSDSDEIIEVDDEADYVYPSDPYELEERANNPLPKITSIENFDDGPLTLSSFGSCTVHPYVTAGRSSINAGSGTTLYAIIGQNFGATQSTGSVTAKYKLKGIEYEVPCTVADWTNNRIRVDLRTSIDSFATGSIKLTANIPYKKNDSAAVELKLKSKSFKAVGFNPNWGLYGTEDYEVKKQRSAASKTPLLPTSFTTIDSSALNYVPAVGDALQRSAGDKGVVVAVGTADSKGRIPVTVWQRNATCKGSLKKGTWKTLKGAFIAKSSETAGTWTKFAH